ncbi:16S rRNA (cytidine(1402)-2'-O)-methyltransferase [Chloroflexota bacterium]
MGTLYIVGTPIGNLEDISSRALRVLSQVSLIASENPQRTRRLLARYEIPTRMVRYTDAYDRKKQRRLRQVLGALEKGDVALVSEAGMPGLADPGYELIQEALEQGVPLVAVPGPTALASALSVAGFPCSSFCYLGFLPRGSSARRSLLSPLVDLPLSLVAHEAPHRLMDALADLEDVFGCRQVAVACELTKLYEGVQRGTAAELLAHYRAHRPRGEFTIVIAPPSLKTSESARYNEAEAGRHMTSEEAA